MSKAYELISESLLEIIEDMEKTGGKNLIRRVVEKPTPKENRVEKMEVSQNQAVNENFVTARI